MRGRSLAVGALGGLAIAAVVLGVIAGSGPVVASAPAYTAGADGPAVLRTYTVTTDPHRQPLPLRSPLVVVGPAAWLGLALMLYATRHRLDARVAAGLVAVAGVAWAWVAVTRVWQAAGELPGVLLAVIPGRYGNLAMLPTIPLAVAVLAASPGAMWVALGLVGAEAVLLALGSRLAFELLLYVVLGAAAGSALGAAGPSRRAGAVATALLAVAIVVVGGPDLLRRMAGLGIGVVVAAVANAVVPDADGLARLRGVITAACVIVGLAALRAPHVPNQWDAGSERASADERGLAAWLATGAPADAMLVTPLWPPTWLQGKTGHPVLLDTMTLANMAYFPATASVVGHIVRDVFGVDFADAAAVERLRGPDGMLRPTSPAWLAAWEARGCDEWRAIGSRYGFRYVWAERAHPVGLPVAWRGEHWALHVVPETCATTAGPS